MGLVDLHIHTAKSRCGLHTLLEILALAKQKGLQLVAITDHDTGPGTGIRVMSYRFPKVYDGIHVLAGIELSIRDGGEIRVPKVIQIPDLDLCLAGFHGEVRTLRDDPARCTDDLEAALARYPFIDVLTHPTIVGYALEPARTAALLQRHGVAVEINNCALRYGKERAEWVLELLGHCVERRVPVAVNSDTHTAPELGGDELALPLLALAGVPPELVITASVERAMAFVESRRHLKKI